ncbi:MAG TPA: hypothetical protein PLK99_08135, partial [Burkholderiales bacterium]|nr:hypothetical protein [Burkholderiales bacterium]
GALLMAIPLSASAGPDWEVIHQERHDLARREAMHMARCKAARHPVAKVQPQDGKLKKEAG